MEFSEVLSLVNYGFVLFFGIVVSLCFAGINFKNHKNKQAASACLFLCTDLS